MTSQKPTQVERVLKMLVEADAVESTTFYRSFLPRFSVAIHKLRKQGYVIQKYPCTIEEHNHEGTSWWYELVALPWNPTEDGRLSLRGAE